MESDRRNATVKLAAVISAVSALVAVAVSAAGDIPQAAIVLPVIIVAFAISWLRAAPPRSATTRTTDHCVRAARSTRLAHPVR